MKRNLLSALTILFVAACMVNCGNKSSENAADATEDSLREAQQIADSIAQAAREQMIQDSIRVFEEAKNEEANYNGYRQKIKEARREFDNVGEYVECSYALFDITGDGKPELFVEAGTCEADYILYIYTFSDGKVKRLAERSAGHTGYYRGSNYIIDYWAHMGSYCITKLTSDGNRIIEKELGSADEAVDYPTRSEPSLEMYSDDDMSALKHAFGL